MLMLAVLIVISLASCSITTPKDTGKSNMIGLAPIDEPLRKRGRSSAVVNYPTVPERLDTYRIAIMPEDNKWDYVSGSRWVEFLPYMIQSSFLESLGNSNIFYRTSSDRKVNNSYYTIDIDIKSFEIEYENNIPSVEISMSFTMKRSHDKRLITKFSLNEKVPASGNNIEGIRYAFQKAYSRIKRGALLRISKRI